MTYECGDCNYFQNSKDVDRHGRHYCKCRKQYVEMDESAKYCKYFEYVSRYVLTKICTILNLPTDSWFKAFDAVKDSCVAADHPEWLTRYNDIGPGIAKAMDADPARFKVAQDMMDKFLGPADQYYRNHEYADAARLFRDMIRHLEQHYA